MARTESTMQPLGTLAPDFSLPDVLSGKKVSRDGVKGAGGLLVMFLCVHCPFVKHVEQGVARFAGDYAGQGLGIVGISSNDADAYPDDSPEGMRAQAKRLGFTFPYLYDESQDVARAYDAACTPDFFLYDRDLKLVYRGQFDPWGSRVRVEINTAVISAEQVVNLFAHRSAASCSRQKRTVSVIASSSGVSRRRPWLAARSTDTR